MAFQKVELTDEKRAALEAENEDILVLSGPEKAPWLVAIRRPTRQETIGFKTHAKRDETTANEQLVRRIAVFPPAVDMDRQLERWPLMCDGIGNSTSFKEFLGFTVEEHIK